MKKHVLFTILIMSCFIGLIGANLSEGFENSFEPAGWENITVSGSKVWTQSSGNQHSGSYSARFSSTSGEEGALITPRLDLTLSGTDQLSFWLKQDWYSSTYNCITSVYISTDGGSNYVLLEEYNTAEYNYSEKNIDLESGIEQTNNVKIKFIGYDNYSDGLYLDDVAGPAIYVDSSTPGAAASPVPEDSSTGLELEQTLSWVNGANTETIDLYFSDNQADVENKDAGALVVSSENIAEHSLYDLTQSTDYYWRIVSKNSQKTETDGPVWTFTTKEITDYGGGTAEEGGYYYANSSTEASNAPSQPNYNWIDISTTGTDVSDVINSDSSVGGPYEIGFTFNYFGVDYTQFYICADGYISLVEEASSDYTNDPIPTAGDPNGIIALLWDDMNPGDDSVLDYHLYYENVSNRLIVTYEKMPEYSADSNGWFTAQVILESNGNILMQYKDVGSSFDLSSCSVGLENHLGDKGVEYLYNGNGGVLYTAREGEIAIAFGKEEQTLPVTLSSFTVAQTEDNLVKLEWITESETDLLGYNIFRNDNELLHTSNRINSSMINALNSSSGNSYVFIDEPENEEMYYYWLESVNNDGSSDFFGPIFFDFQNEDGENENQVNFVTELQTAYPNPFNPETKITFSVREGENAELEIFNIKGRSVKKYNQFKSGEHQVIWKGKNNKNEPVSSGVYFYRLTTSSYSKIYKMLLLK